MVGVTLARDGYTLVPHDTRVANWAAAAHQVAKGVLKGDGVRRHGGTWLVGVDALPNAADGSIGGVSLSGAWLDQITTPAHWHQAQLSVIFPGYPQQDPDESDAAHRFRRDRDAAHVDGLLPEGPHRRRHLREPHGFVAGIALNDVAASPLVVWPGSHKLMRAAFTDAFAGISASHRSDCDVTDIYQATRKTVFETCPRVELRTRPGEVILLHRHLLHGVAPWGDCAETRPRMIAYFRPLIPAADWL